MSEPSFPYVVKATKGVLMFTVACWAVLGVLAFAVIWFNGGSTLPTDVLIWVGGAIVLFVYVMGAIAYMDRKVLHDDSIEFQTLFGTRRMRIADIAGFRRRRVGNLPFAVAFGLVPLDPEEGERTLVAIPGADAAVDAWLGKLRDLDRD